MQASSQTLLIKGIGQLVTVDPARCSTDNPLGVISDAAILIRDGRIAWLGSAAEAVTLDVPAQACPDIRLNAAGALAMPGLIDAHTHAVFAGDRADEFEMRLQGKSYLEIAQAGGGILKTVRATREATKETLVRLTRERLLRMRAQGVTTVEVKSGYGLDADCEIRCLEALRDLQQSADCPVDIVPTYMGAHDIPPEYAGRTDAYVDWLCETQIPQVARQGLAVFCDVFCEEGYFSVSQSRRILETARQCGLKLKIHAEEFADCGGAVLAGELNAASADHLLRISEAGIAALKAGGVVATLLPGTAFYLRIPEYAPAKRLLDAGVPVALATDFNPGSCTIDSLQWIMALACLQMRMTPVDVIRGVTLHAAQALDLHRDRGCLAVGMRADIALFAVRSYQELLYRMGSNRLTGVVSNGIYRDRAALEAACAACG